MPNFTTHELESFSERLRMDIARRKRGYHNGPQLSTLARLLAMGALFFPGQVAGAEIPMGSENTTGINISKAFSEAASIVHEIYHDLQTIMEYESSPGSNWAAALKAYEKRCFDEDIKDPRACYALGVKEFSLAKQTEGLSIGPEILGETLAAFFAKMDTDDGYKREGLKAFEKAHELAPRDLIHTLNLALAHYELGNKDNAYSYFKEAYSQNNQVAGVIATLHGYDGKEAMSAIDLILNLHEVSELIRPGTGRHFKKEAIVRGTEILLAETNAYQEAQKPSAEQEGLEKSRSNIM